MIDTDGDGKITEDDLIATFGHLGMHHTIYRSPSKLIMHSGQTPSRKLIDSLLTQPGGSTTRTINFTQFLTLFGQHLLELADSEQEILDAFACFDEHDEGGVEIGPLGGRSGDAGVIGQEGLRGWLRDYGDKMSEAEVSRRSPNGILYAHVSRMFSWIGSSRVPLRINRESSTMSSLQRR